MPPDDMHGVGSELGGLVSLIPHARTRRSLLYRHLGVAPNAGSQSGALCMQCTTLSRI